MLKKFKIILSNLKEKYQFERIKEIVISSMKVLTWINLHILGLNKNKKEKEKVNFEREKCTDSLRSMWALFLRIQ